MKRLIHVFNIGGTEWRKLIFYLKSPKKIFESLR